MKMRVKMYVREFDWSFIWGKLLGNVKDPLWRFNRAFVLVSLSEKIEKKESERERICIYSQLLIGSCSRVLLEK
jgi:hypothetical protein